MPYQLLEKVHHGNRFSQDRQDFAAETITSQCNHLKQPRSVPHSRYMSIEGCLGDLLRVVQADSAYLTEHHRLSWQGEGNAGNYTLALKASFQK